MGILKDTIEQNFGTTEDFSSWDLHKLTGINQKVIQMNLKKMHNRFEIWSSNEFDNHKLYAKEESNILKQKENDLIDKYSLKQKKQILF